MNCGKHRRPSIRRPTAARQRYEQSRLSEKAETARNGNFRPAIRRPTAEVESKTATSRQNVAAAPKRSASTGCPNKNGFSPPLPAHSGDPHRTLPAFSRKNKLLSGKEPAIPPLIPEEYKRLKGCRHNQRPDPPPPARRKRLLRKPNLRSPPLPATDSPHGGPDRQPPQLLPQPPQPEAFETRPASEVVRFSPNEGKRDHNVLFGGAATRIPPRKKDLRESRNYKHGLRPRTNDRRMTDIEIYDCRGKSIFFREPVPNKRRIRP